MMEDLKYWPQVSRVQESVPENVQDDTLEALRADKQWLESLVCVLAVCLGVSTGITLAVIGMVIR